MNRLVAFEIALASLWAVSSHTAYAQPPAVVGTAAAQSRPQERLREGIEWTDRSGVFRSAGDRMAFFPDGGPSRLVVLENLALERVVRTIESSPNELRWSVSGAITEYRGANYLLLRRVVAIGSAGASSP